jgi:hypothetical protein
MHIFVQAVNQRVEPEDGVKIINNIKFGLAVES